MRVFALICTFRLIKCTHTLCSVFCFVNVQMHVCSCFSEPPWCKIQARSFLPAWAYTSLIISAVLLHSMSMHHVCFLPLSSRAWYSMSMHHVYSLPLSSRAWNGMSMHHVCFLALSSRAWYTFVSIVSYPLTAHSPNFAFPCRQKMLSMSVPL